MFLLCYSGNMEGKHKGFTLVELLIVIVVIAILAAISIVSYGSIKNRAYNASVESAANSALKVIQLAYTSEGTIQLTDIPGSSISICIGNPSDFPANSTFKAGQCSTVGGWASQELWDAYKQHASGNLAVGEMYDGDYAHIRGIQYIYKRNHTTNKYSDYLIYDLIGKNQKCSLPGATTVDAIDSGYDGSKETSCWVNLNELLGEAPLDW